ncbi:MAG: DHHW family protein [Clostridia bacterium]
MKKTNILITSLFCAYIGGFFVLNALSEDKIFSEQENRTLGQKPEFSFETLVSGEFTKKYETYVTDQFVFRDKFMEIKSNTESLLGKMENNDVYISTENTLIDKFDKPSYEQVDINMRYINNFAQAVEIPVYFSLIPTQNDIYQYKLPQNAPIYSQKEVIDYAYALYSGIDVYDALMDKKDEYIYYNTDHHWTSLGAYYAYATLMDAMEKVPSDIENLEKETLSESFNGTIYSSSGVRYVKSDIIDIYTKNQTIEILDVDGLRYSELYDMSKLEQKDQYEVFLGGNDPLVKLTGTGEGKLLILKDSYTNAQVPFMLENYEEIHLVDLRFYKIPMSEYVEENEIDQVLISYSISNFTTDTNLIFLR